MNAFNWWVPLFTLFGFIAVVPVWIHFSSKYTADLPIYIQFFADLTMPALAALFLASWADPR